ncbi:hypothetical protein BH10PLA2_BH10PLA2_00720 [soil metagenome]
MTRNLDSATETASQQPTISPIALVKLEFDSGDVRFHTWLGDITYDGEVYTGAGQLGFIGPIDEDSDLTRNTMEIGLRGIPSDIIAIVLGENFQGRPATIYFGYLDSSTMQLVGEPAPFTGKMDYPTIRIGQQCQVRLMIEDEFAILDKPKARRYNNADQQARFPGDLGLEFVEQSTEKSIYWGQKAP